jgi:argininosuccinate lyase
LTDSLRREREEMTQEVKKILLAYSGGLDTAEMKRFSPLIDDDVYGWLDPSLCIERRNIHGGTGSETVKNALNNAKEELKT